jgi:methylation protein EvaC
MRYILKKSTNHKSRRLLNLLKLEKKNNIDSAKGSLIFKEKVLKSRIELLKKLKIIKSKGYKICGYGATSKSTTILNYCKIDNRIIDCIFDTTPSKIGKLSPGMHIPIIDYKFFRKSSYKYVFLFAWNHKSEIQIKERNLKNIKWISHFQNR